MSYLGGLFMTFTNDALRVFIEEKLKKTGTLQLVRLDATHYMLPVPDPLQHQQYQQYIKDLTEVYFNEIVYNKTSEERDSSAAPDGDRDNPWS